MYSRLNDVVDFESAGFDPQQLAGLGAATRQKLESQLNSIDELTRAIEVDRKAVAGLAGKQGTSLEYLMLQNRKQLLESRMIARRRLGDRIGSQLRNFYTGSAVENIPLSVAAPPSAYQVFVNVLGAKDKELINAASDTVYSFVTLGGLLGGDDNPYHVAVTQLDIESGYGSGYSSIVFRGGTEVAFAIATGGLSIFGKVGTAIKLVDTAGNFYTFGSGFSDALDRGLTLQNSIQIVGGAFGLSGNIAVSGPRTFQLPTNSGGLSALDDIRIPSNANAATRIPRRLMPADLAQLQRQQGVEFAQVYITGPGKNGGGGQYLLIRGTEGHVNIPVGSNVRLINHTHPTTLRGQTVPLRASGADRRALGALQDAGSPQRISTVVTESGEVIRFSRTRNNLGN